MFINEISEGVKDYITEVTAYALYRLGVSVSEAGDAMDAKEEDASLNHLTMGMTSDLTGTFFLSTKSKYVVVNEIGVVKYFAKGKNNMRLQHIILEDAEHKRLGEIKESKKGIKKVLSAWPGEYNYELFLSGKSIGSIHSTIKWSRAEHELLPLGWKITPIKKRAYEVTDNTNKRRAKIREQSLSFGNRLRIEYEDLADECIAVLIALVLFASLESRSRDGAKGVYL